MWKRHIDQLRLRHVKFPHTENIDIYVDFPSNSTSEQMQPSNESEEFIGPQTRRYPLRNNRRPPDKLRL